MEHPFHKMHNFPTVHSVKASDAALECASCNRVCQLVGGRIGCRNEIVTDWAVNERPRFFGTFFSAYNRVTIHIIQRTEMLYAIRWGGQERRISTKTLPAPA